MSTTTDVYRRDTATWVSFAALFAFGLLNAVLGPVLPYLRETEKLSYLVSSFHQVAYALGGMAAGVLATRARGERRRTILVGLTGAALAGLLLGYGRVVPLTLVAAMLVSGLGTAALIRVWAVLADLHGARRAVAMTEGEVAVSLAGVLTPVLVSACAATALSWRFSFVVAGLLVLGSVVAVTRTPFPAPRGSQGDPGDPAGPTAVRTLGTIVAVVALEFTLSFWAASYLHDDVGIAVDTSVAMVSGLYAANLVGRLVASRIARVWPAERVLLLSLATALAGVPVLLAARGSLAAAVGIVVLGMGIGGCFPLASALHVAASRRTADQALGQILAVAGIGQIVGPLAAGAVAQGTSLRVGLLVLPALVVGGALTVRRTRADATG